MRIAPTRHVVGAAVFATSAAIAMSVQVPSRMALSDSLTSSLPGLYDTLLVKLDLSKDAVSGGALVKEAAERVALRNAVLAHPSICFVVRRPG
jgi:hypothetical protein